MPLRRATYRLNGGPEVRFYVEELPEPPGLDWRFQYKSTPARLRLKSPGDFNIELPVTAAELAVGPNRVTIEIENAVGVRERLDAEFTWDRRPAPLPLDLSDLSRFSRVQEIGQVVNGAFQVDPARNVGRPLPPVAPYALLLLGRPAGSHAATSEGVFAELKMSKNLRLSDSLGGHEVNDP